MGQGANSGRNASLDDKKRRAEGRQQNDPARREIQESIAQPGAGATRGKAQGAFGKEGVANRGGTGGIGEGGGGGGADPKSENADVPAHGKTH